jgi:hypothetical protein
MFNNTFFTGVAYHPDDSQLVTVGTDRKVRGQYPRPGPAPGQGPGASGRGGSGGGGGGTRRHRLLSGGCVGLLVDRAQSRGRV